MYERDFPLLFKQHIAYLDNSATAQKPKSVLEAMDRYYQEDNANPHRGLYKLSVRATAVFEAARAAFQRFIGAASPSEVIFTVGATESLNLVAQSYGMQNVQPGDEIVLSIAEHHSNLVPWQRVAAARGAKLCYLYVDEKGSLLPGELDKITPRTKIVAVAHASNVLGFCLPIDEIVRRAHENGAVVVLDCAQSAAHTPVDVTALGVDFAAFAGHKMLGPMGIGVLWGREALLEGMPPFLSGGEMIETVREEGFTCAPLPHKFEAGTQNVGGAAGLAAAIEYYQGIDRAAAMRHETALVKAAAEALAALPHARVLGPDDPKLRCGIIPFAIEGVHPHDVATILDEQNVAIRAGHHCAQPLMRRLGVQSLCRASFAFYNTQADVEALIQAVSKVRGVMGYGD